MSEQAKATPRPWTAKDQGEGLRGKSLGICIAGPNGLPMFFLPRGTAEHEANARLVAAAPDLLEALLLRQARGHHDTCSHMLSEEYRCDCGYLIGQVAIAKATGAAE